ncbi:hypothetical protein D3C87_1940480 [compost metagenome]
MRRAAFMPPTRLSRSIWADRKLGRMAGPAVGSADFRWIEPNDSGRSCATPIVMPGCRSRMRSAALA